MVRESFEKGFAEVWDKHQQRLVAWQADRIATVARLLGVAPDQVGWAEIVWCHSLHGVPPLEDEAPRIGDVPMDGRLRRAVAGR